jgi:transposase
MAAYSIDLRQKILRAWERHLGSQRSIADSFGVSLAFVEKVLRQYRATGDLAPKAACGRPEATPGRGRPSRRAAADGCQSGCDAGGVVHRGGRGDRRAGQRADDVPRAPAPRIAAQKKSLHASERDTERVQQARAAYQEAIAALDPQHFKFIDESGVTLAMTRRYGRAPQGERGIGTAPQNYGANVTMLAALGNRGVEAVMTIDSATDAEVFQVYVAQVLRPTLRPGDIVIMDNLRAHKVAGIREAVEQAGARLLYLPPYSPDLSPIELCWSKLKSALRTAQARTREALERAIALALATITVSDAQHWFHHCGYALH